MAYGRIPLGSLNRPLCPPLPPLESTALSDSSALLTADGRGVGDEEDDDHYIGWVFRNAAREAGVLAPTYDSACVFMHVTRGNERCAVKTPLWNDGVNHVMVDFGDSGR